MLICIDGRNGIGKTVNVPIPNQYYYLDGVRHQKTMSLYSLCKRNQIHLLTKETITITQAVHSSIYYCLIRNIGKRAIQVFFTGINLHIENRETIIIAARYATAKGWKKVIVYSDNTYGHIAKILNIAGYNCAYFGIDYKGYLIDAKSDIIEFNETTKQGDKP